MRQSRVLFLLVALVVQCLAQDSTPAPEWNGDPSVCTPDSSPPNPGDPPPPQFPRKAEFALERIEIRHILDKTLPTRLSLYQYLYDQDANKLVLVKNENGFSDLEYFYYESALKSTYYRGEFCVVSPILKEIDSDGTSALQLPDGTTRIRPLNEFLLFSSNDPRKPPIRPKYKGSSTVRGIPVTQWETCIVNKAARLTQKRIWYFAASNAVVPIGPVGNMAIPVQAIINASVSFENGTQVAEFDEVFNVHSYRPGIIESTDQLAPPKGVFCKYNGSQSLASLSEIGIEWPDRFSVRVEASSSRSAQWQRFHLRYDGGRQGRGRRIRYDYLPAGSQDYRSVIHDYGANLTYSIDLRTGACDIGRLVPMPDVNPIQNPIEFFIKYESEFISSNRARVWEFNGYRACRGNSIKCTIATSELDNFPPMVDPDTGKPNGETWDATNVEYAWSIRSPFAQPPPGSSKKFDYPAHIYMRFYRYGNPGNPSPFNIRTEDLEYEFYEMSHELNTYDFDESICYRANNMTYAHLGMILTMDRDNAFDDNQLDRRSLERDFREYLVNQIQVLRTRISGIEIDHIRKGREITVFFTILGPRPAPGTEAGVDLNDTPVAQVRETLKRLIDSGNFKFQVPLSGNSSGSVEFTAKMGSLDAATAFVISQTAAVKVVKKSCSSQSVAVPILIGALLGIFFGALLVAVVRILRPSSMPNIPGFPTSISNPLPSISFSSRKPAEAVPTTSQA